MNAVIPLVIRPSLLDIFGTKAPGIMAGIDNATYHADRSCASSSALKAMLKSPAHYRAYLDGERKETPDMAFGTAFHSRLLEPDDFACRYVAAIDGDRRAKGWKEFEALVSGEGRLLLTSDQSRALEAMVDSVGTHSSAMTLLHSGLKENTLIWRDENTGLWLKARPDNLVTHPSVGVCLDVKTTADLMPEAFARQCVNLDYDLSAAMYLEGLQAVFRRDFDFMFLAVEKTAPFGRALYGAPSEMIERGKRRLRIALSRLRACIDTDEWPPFQGDGSYDILDWPRWAA